ncbi:MAG: RNA polymerase sigma factor [Lachnospiraceae bacterium]|nr:RNA polymerase sigma factor [Lachnospiraceae bacterium]
MEGIDSQEILIRLMNQYQNLIFSICLKLTGDYFVAEDLTQETFLAAYNHLEECPKDAEKAWLARIASNKCIDYLRAAARRVVPTEEDEIHSLENPSDEEPLRQVLNSEIMEELRCCCNALSPPYREVAIAHFLEGKNAKEIADGSQTGVNTIKTHIRRARELLKKSYRKELLQE